MQLSYMTKRQALFKLLLICFVQKNQTHLLSVFQMFKITVDHVNISFAIFFTSLYIYNLE